MSRKFSGYFLIQLIAVILFVNCPEVRSQEALGITTDNRGGIWSAQINPALISHSKHFFDVNIIGGSADFANNYLYIPKEDSNFFGVIPLKTLVNDSVFSFRKHFFYYKDSLAKWGNVSGKIMGPSAMLQFKHHSFGMSMLVRTANSEVNIPWDVGVFSYEDLTYKPLQKQRFNDSVFSISEMTWNEINLTYAYEYYTKSKSSFSFGITGKILLGKNAFYSTFKKLDYLVPDNINVFYYEMDADIGYALGDDFKNYNVKKFILGKTLGFGLGLDAGIVYTKKRKVYVPKNRREEKMCAYMYEDYYYRIGLSFLDFGGIRFKKNAGLHNYYVTNTFAIPDTLLNPKGNTINDYMRYISNELTGDPDSSFVDSTIYIGLPSAVSMQFDYHIYRHFYASLFAIQPVQFHLKDVKRAAQLAFVPRYESLNFGVSMPLSVVNYNLFRAGLSLRIYNLFIGTESLLSLLDMRDLNNADIYFAIKFFLDKGRCNPDNLGGCFFSLNKRQKRKIRRKMLKY